MGSRRGPSRDILFRGEKRTQSIHRKLTRDLEDKKPREVLLKTALKAIASSDERIKAIVAGEEAIRYAYKNLEELKEKEKRISPEEFSNEIKKSWNATKREKGLDLKNRSLNSTILSVLEETLHKPKEKSRRGKE